MAPRVGAVVDALRQEGRLKLLAGRLESVRRNGDGITALFAQRGGGGSELSVGAVINCTGPRTDIGHDAHPLFASLVRQGLARPDPLGLGPESDDSALRSAGGAPLDWIFALGPPTRSAWWEIVAVPEIRTQVERLVNRLSRTEQPPLQHLAAVFFDIGAGI